MTDWRPGETDWRPFHEDEYPAFRAQITDATEAEVRELFEQWRVRGRADGCKEIATVEQIERGSEPIIIGTPRRTYSPAPVAVEPAAQRIGLKPGICEHCLKDERAHDPQTGACP